MLVIAFLLGMCCCGVYLTLLWTMVKRLKNTRHKAVLLSGGMWLRLGILGCAFYTIVRCYGLWSFVAFLGGFFTVHIVFLVRARQKLIKGMK